MSLATAILPPPARAGMATIAPHLHSRFHSWATCRLPIITSTTFLAGSSLSKPSLSSFFLSSSRRPLPRPRSFFIPLMEWQHCSAKLEVDIPCSTAYRCYSDREAIPRWMPFISSVKILADQADLSRWSLKYTAFGQDLEFSWLARNMQPIPNQKIHWRSLEGLPNKGIVRFYPKGPTSCLIELTVSYEVPQILYPVSSALRPFLESLLLRGLERFAKFAGEYEINSPKA